VRTRPLTDLTARELRPLLDEETAYWGRELHWDYSDVAAAVAGGLDRRSLSGHVVEDGAEPLAYGYYMLDNQRAIVGSLFAREGHRGRGLEEELLDALLPEAQAEAASQRVECQTLFSTASLADAKFARAGFQARRRHYLVRDLADPVAAAEASFRLRPFPRDDLVAAPRLIHRSHEGSLDAALNLTYTTPALCRGFVETLVLRSGCGRFDPEASFLADGGDGALGVVLASSLSRTNGHLCQISVSPAAQGRGLGRLLVSAALRAFQARGLATASLSVTVDNSPAYALYGRMGFRLRREFTAHAWVRPPARLELPA
jgi:ribosomal protein S18 acetylase RimI-like enzyme